MLKSRDKKGKRIVFDFFITNYTRFWAQYKKKKRKQKKKLRATNNS